MDVMWADVLRAALVLTPAALLVGVSLAVLISYGRAYRMDRRIARSTGRKHVGLLTGHVTGITTSYLLLVSYDVIDTIERLGGDLTWRTPARGVAYLIGMVSLISILRFEWLRYRSTVDGVSKHDE